METKQLGKTQTIDIAKYVPIYVPLDRYIMGIEVASALVSGDVTLLYSMSGDNAVTAATDWLIAKDSNGDDIVETLVAGSYVMFPINGLPSGIHFALKFAAATGEVTITAKS
jgi:hypothetical protein